MLCVGSGCGSKSSPSFSPEMLTPPVTPGSGQPRLQVDSEGTMWLSWLAPLGGEDQYALRYTRRTDTRWTDPATVATGTDWFVNWADLPSVHPLPDGRIAAHYLESNGERALAYAVRITQTTGDGTWHPPVTPHRDATPTEHGFVSLLPWENHQLLTVWLDGRKMSDDGHGQGEMTLRGAVLDSTGTVTHRAVLDSRTCECCATSAVRIGAEALVAYRDRSTEEIRDIHLVRFDGEQWSDPMPLHDDGWKIEGCPVNGPVLAAQDGRVVAAWFTAANGKPRVKTAFSDNGGHQFTEPVIVADGQTKGRVDAVLLDDGTAIVSWLGEQEDRGVIQVRAVSPDGPTSPPKTIGTVPSASRSVGFPQLVRRKEQLYGAWVGPDSADASTVRVVRTPISAVHSGS
ncbi:hypothetical protein BSZ35_13430 [Salinibacter sp. 10B]|nr:hypothetical protein BSZ35_13430 [Salinibacter sp. 10B]